MYVCVCLCWCERAFRTQNWVWSVSMLRVKLQLIQTIAGTDDFSVGQKNLCAGTCVTCCGGICLCCAYTRLMGVEGGAVVLSSL